MLYLSIKLKSRKVTLSKESKQWTIYFFHKICPCMLSGYWYPVTSGALGGYWNIIKQCSGQDHKGSHDSSLRTPCMYVCVFGSNNILPSISKIGRLVSIYGHIQACLSESRLALTRKTSARGTLFLLAHWLYGNLLKHLLQKSVLVDIVWMKFPQ